MQSDTALLDLIAQTIFDKKGTNILALDLRGISSLKDYAIIGEGHVDRHVIAIAHAIQKALGEQGIYPRHVEGFRTGDWIVMDYPSVMVHLFMPGMRDRYQLEELWKAASIVDVHISVTNSLGKLTGY
jgi:ribosome-associated protein